MAVTVYKYGTPAKAARQLPEHVERQFRLAHELRNELVAIHQGYEQAVADAWASAPEFAEADQTVQDASDLVFAVQQQMKAERVEDRSTKPRPESKQALVEARTALSNAKTAKKVARDLLYPVIKEKITEAKTAEYAAQKALYSDFVQARGLYWATYNDVLDHHKTAVKRIAADRKAGKPAQLRFHRWDGTGTLTIQLQRGAGDPARTPSLLASGEGKWRNVVQVTPWSAPVEFDALLRGDRRRAGHGLAKLRFGSANPVFELPVQVHRMLPADADVTLVRLTRTVVGGHPRLTLTLTAKLPDVSRADNGRAVALHLGWRARKDGAIRVGTIVSPAGPLRIPEHLADLIETRGDGSWAEVILPAAFRDSVGKAEELRSTRDQNLDLVRAKLATFLADHGPAQRVHPYTGEVTDLTSADIQRWRSPARFASLAIEWRTLAAEGRVPVGAGWPQAGFTELTAYLEAWRKQDKHLWQWEAHGRDQYLARRDDGWKRVAAWATDTYSHILLADYTFAGMSSVPEVDTEDTPQGRAARALRVMAAPGTLKAAIGAAAQRRGVTVDVIDSAAAKATIMHFACGGENTRDGRYKQSAVVACDHCGNAYDQDRNAALHALAASGLVTPPPPGTARAQNG